ncbi:MAG: GNAT family N-acetyltransferase [Bacteroidota bacterium]
MNEIAIHIAGLTEIDSVQPLWEELNKQHAGQSTHFKNRFKKMTWEQRKSRLLKKADDLILVYATLKNSDKLIGYCIATTEINSDEIQGEIDSILIEEAYRGSGIGKKLFEKSLEWLENKGVDSPKLLVAVGNESVLDYYKNFGFYPLHIIMQKRNELNIN